jgi:transketolase
MTTHLTVHELQQKANAIRMSIIDMLEDAGSGHTAGPLGMADIFTALYFGIMRHDPANPDWEDRDRLILSNGHICPVMYATMAHAGYFPVGELATLRKFGSRLQGHPHREFLPYVETSSGPLGSGLSQTIGMAIADRIDRGVVNNRMFYCLLGDGELNEGNVWEAAMLGGKEKLHNLIAVIDRNNIQIDGYTESVMPLEPLADKWESFGWHVQEIDGHDFDQISQAFRLAQTVFEKPSVIIAHTVAGKGIPEIERDYRWHGKPPTTEQEQKWLKDLRTLQGTLDAE